jgi:hypothetical protein
MTQKAKPEESQPGRSPLKWGIVFGIAILAIIVLGIISSKSIHVILAKQSSSAESSQSTSQ